MFYFVTKYGFTFNSVSNNIVNMPKFLAKTELKYLFDKPMSTVLSEMSVLIVYVCVYMCLYMCVHMWESSGITCIAQNNYKQR